MGGDDTCPPHAVRSGARNQQAEEPTDVQPERRVPGNGDLQHDLRIVLAEVRALNASMDRIKYAMHVAFGLNVDDPNSVSKVHALQSAQELTAAWRAEISRWAVRAIAAAVLVALSNLFAPTLREVLVRPKDVLSSPVMGGVIPDAAAANPHLDGLPVREAITSEVTDEID